MIVSVACQACSKGWTVESICYQPALDGGEAAPWGDVRCTCGRKVIVTGAFHVVDLRRTAEEDT